MTEPHTGSAADYLAAERTFFAWIRTGLALMGFGFVVARFGLFLEALQIEKPNLPLRSVGISPWFGATLILLGIVVNLWSVRSYIRLVRDLNRGQRGFARPSTFAITVAVLLAAIGEAMAVYLVSVRQIVTIPSH